MQPFVAFELQQWLPWGSGRILVLLPSELLVVASSAGKFKRSGERCMGGTMEAWTEEERRLK